MTDRFSAATRAVRAALESDTHHSPVVPPIHLTSTYAFKSFGVKGTYDYTRSGNPTRDALGEAIATLEGGEGAVITASGMAAVTLVTQLLGPDDVLVAPHDCYGGTYRLFAALAKRNSFHVEFFDQTNTEALAAALAKQPKDRYQKIATMRDELRAVLQEISTMPVLQGDTFTPRHIDNNVVKRAWNWITGKAN